MVSILLLAAGAASRMQGQDKLLIDVNGMPMLRHCAVAALASNASETLVVLAPERPQRRSVLAGLDLVAVDAADWHLGMAASIRAGMAAISANSAAVIIALADMPDVGADHYNRLIAAFGHDRGQAICRAVTADGKPGHPVLFGPGFFAALTRLTGDSGGRDLLRTQQKHVVAVPTPGQGALVDIDTPADLARWQSRRG